MNPIVPPSDLSAHDVKPETPFVSMIQLGKN